MDLRTVLFLTIIAVFAINCASGQSIEGKLLKYISRSMHENQLYKRQSKSRFKLPTLCPVNWLKYAS